MAHGAGLQNLISRVRIPSRPHCEFSLTGKTLRCGRKEQGSSPGFTPISEYSSTVRVSVFQIDDVGSIPATHSKYYIY